VEGCDDDDAAADDDEKKGRVEVIPFFSHYHL
jgi:hypothetical protein